MQLIKPLLTPAELFNQFPNDPTLNQFIRAARFTTQNIVKGKENKLLVVVGPCSIHDVRAAKEYALRLKKLSDQLADKLFIIMRVYFEKPRTRLGWKGLISDPHLDGSFDMNAGLTLARKFLLELAQLELPAATEFLDSFIPQYLSDLITWSAIGARTTQSQIHREIASGLAMPVGFKNTTDGNISIAIDAVKTAHHPHHYLSISNIGTPAILHTQGNQACHIVLRGSNQSTNYHEEMIDAVRQELLNSHLIPRVMIDCSHGNSGRNPENQARVIESLLPQLTKKNHGILGVMIESHLLGGKQTFTRKETLQYGLSITDGCISWEETSILLNNLANKL